MKNKILLAAVAAAMVLTLTACGGSGSNTPAATVTEGTMAITDLHVNGLDGLGDYLAGNGIIGGTPLKMKADLIGAVDGEKYSFTYDNATVVVEIYEFDLQNLNETGKETLDSIREKGTFKVLEAEAEAKISNSGKYIMLYSSANTDETQTAQAQKAEQIFQEYDEKESQIKVDQDKQDEGKDTADSSSTASDAASGTGSESSASTGESSTSTAE